MGIRTESHCLSMHPIPRLFRQLWRATPALLVALLLTACNTHSHRARQYSSFFNSLEEDEQIRLQKGHVGLGDSREMVYIALGSPRHHYWNNFNEEVWEYLGYVEPDEEAEKNQRVAYVTVNDFILAKPWNDGRFSTIAIYFEEDRVIHHQLKNPESRFVAPNSTPMVLPPKPKAN